jgi:uncharacterized protein (TIGR03435 family)
MPVYAMVIAKGGPKLKELAPGTSALPALRPGGPLGLSRRGGMAAIGLHEQGGMDALAARLSSQADRPIVDRTGLKGNYEILLRWTPPRASASADSAGDPGISLFDALGRLKIEYRRF